MFEKGQSKGQMVNTLNNAPILFLITYLKSLVNLLSEGTFSLTTKVNFLGYTSYNIGILIQLLVFIQF